MCLSLSLFLPPLHINFEHNFVRIVCFEPKFAFLNSAHRETSIRFSAYVLFLTTSVAQTIILNMSRFLDFSRVTVQISSPEVLVVSSKYFGLLLWPHGVPPWI